MAKEPSEKEIQETVNAAGRLAAFLRDEWDTGSTLLDVLDLAAQANVGITKDTQVASAAYLWVLALDDEDGGHE